jgi:putative DNA primase/helicase
VPEPYDPFSQYYDKEPSPDEQWNMSLEHSTLSAQELELLAVNPRPVLIEPWARQGDLGFIFAARGVGKTWIGIHIAHCLADNKAFGPWKVPSQINKVLYMDGEMPVQDVQYRNHILGGPSPNLFYLNHEILFERSNRILNLSNALLQEAVIEFCKKESFGVLILDNLSTLVSGIDENNAVDWEKILPWLLRLRRAHITVIFIHHAGRSGQMRGHSKREDPSAWIINLKMPKNDPEHEIDGAHFITSFEKYRNAPARPNDLEWIFTPLANGSEILVRFEQSNPMDVFIELIKAGVHQCCDIAEEMNISAATVSRLAQKAENLGFITIKGRKYSLNDSPKKGYNPYND